MFRMVESQFKDFKDGRVRVMLVVSFIESDGNSVVKDYRLDEFDSDYEEELNASAIFMAKLTPAGSDNENDVGPSYDSDALSERKQAVLYDGKNLSDKHESVFVFDSDETLQSAKESQLRMKDKEIKLVDYSKLNNLSEIFVPRKEVSAKQSYFSPLSETTIVEIVKPVKEVPKQLPKTSQAKKYLKCVKCHINTLEEVVKYKTTQTDWFDSVAKDIKKVFVKDVEPIVKSLRKWITDFEKELKS
ncbi:hypothetical protein Tco_0954673 [Tanacetum coccineum]|uniref:Uncharacterized protein n=1 Tax=Tanacetum coccineum TaxID=301880 RepID=A0ABQ5E523_9ASTR